MKFLIYFFLLMLPIHGVISSNFGKRIDPITGFIKFHSGVDLVGRYAEPVAATQEGMILHAGRLHGYGKTVVVQHEGDITTYYAHLGKIFISKGDRVVKGQILGWLGMSGRSTGPHLHYEMRKNGRPIDPLK